MIGCQTRWGLGRDPYAVLFFFFGDIEKNKRAKTAVKGKWTTGTGGSALVWFETHLQRICGVCVHVLRCDVDFWVFVGVFSIYLSWQMKGWALRQSLLSEVWEALEFILVDLFDDCLIYWREHRVLASEVLVEVIHIALGFLQQKRERDTWLYEGFLIERDSSLKNVLTFMSFKTDKTFVYLWDKWGYLFWNLRDFCPPIESPFH